MATRRISLHGRPLVTAALTSGLSIVAGCSGGSPGASESTRTAPAAVESCPPVEGSEVVHYVANGHEIGQAPAPASALGIQAVVPSGASTWPTYPAAIRFPPGDGFDFPGLTAPSYDLELTTAYSWWDGAQLPLYFASSARSLDLGVFVLGRPGVKQPSAGTTLQLDIDGLDPFVPMNNGSGGDVQLISPGAGIGWSSLPSLANPPLQAGATTFTGTVDYTSLTQLSLTPGVPGAGLIDASKGDATYLSELAAEDAPSNVSAWGLTKAAQLPGFSVANGATTNVKATLAPVPQQSFAPTLHPAKYDDLATSVNPGASPYLFWGHVDCITSGMNRTYAGGYADLMIHQEPPTLTADTPLALTYGDPYPASWPVIANFWAFYLTTWTLPDPDGGAPVTYEQLNEVGGVDSVQAMVDRNLDPAVGPVGHPRIDGKDLMSPVNGLSAAPKLAWDAPALGTATYYFVDIGQLSVSQGQASFGEVAQLTTTATSLVIPPGTLAAGSTYIIQITAYYAPGADVSAQPFAVPMFPSWNADVVSALVTP